MCSARSAGGPHFVFVCDALKGCSQCGLRSQYWRATRSHGIRKSFAGPRSSWKRSGSCRWRSRGSSAGLPAILGHNFPVWLKFKGARAWRPRWAWCSGWCPWRGRLPLPCGGLFLFASGYVSLASIVGAVAVPATVAFTARGSDRTPLLAFTAFAALLIVARHRQNIKRLLNGTENRFKKPK